MCKKERGQGLLTSLVRRAKPSSMRKRLRPLPDEETSKKFSSSRGTLPEPPAELGRVARKIRQFLCLSALAQFPFQINHLITTGSRISSGSLDLGSDFSDSARAALVSVGDPT